MGLFQKPLLPAHYENEDVQVSAELCSNITIKVIGLAKGEITILSGNEDMIHIKASVQAKESILKNAAALDPVQDGNRYTYTIHTPLEEKLEKAVTFQVFVTIPKNLDSLESFTIAGANVELSIGNIGHTFIKNLAVNINRGDVAIDNFYGESAIIKNSHHGSITGKYSVARLFTQAKSGKIRANVHLLNTDEAQPPPKVICMTYNYPVNLAVDGTDLFSGFTVEAKTQCQPLDVKVMLANPEQRLMGNFINFGGATKIKLSGNFQGRIETRTHYGKIFIDDPKFERLEDAVLTVPSLSDRNFGATLSQSNISSDLSGSSSSSIHQSSAMSSRTSSQGSQGSSTWDRDDPRHHQDYLNYPYQANGNQPVQTSKSAPPSAAGSGSNSRTNSLNGSIHETRSVYTTKSEGERKKKRDEDEGSNTREVIGVIGQGTGLVMVKNSSGDITVSLV
ncbi:hypothetical protein BGZ80_007756 [Entomortierella chlamydospora]|uniref:Adhesin domain-containing protein n=1 Tax=Entomortierella chlamydospora TaxID=101097 RepID=A0A9P6T1H2_9FUNG|nr:hypothetical protein BGZ79_007868 [Entomortierella chlamydospora]KAG0017940.1 hypothetical protein BGZ80_007756 [Entomortierella chlamydospora]